MFRKYRVLTQLHITNSLDNISVGGQYLKQKTHVAHLSSSQLANVSKMLFNSSQKIKAAIYIFSVQGMLLYIVSSLVSCWFMCVGSLMCHINCDTGLPIMMVLYEDPWHSRDKGKLFFCITGRESNNSFGSVTFSSKSNCTQFIALH